MASRLWHNPLHSTMSLLNRYNVSNANRLGRTLHSTMSLLNHNAKYYAKKAQDALHSTMSLLNPGSDVMVTCPFHTLHSTMSLLNQNGSNSTTDYWYHFTFHNVSIKSRNPRHWLSICISLHSTMSLLNHVIADMLKMSKTTLHSTMSLLNHAYISHLVN